MKPLNFDELRTIRYLIARARDEMESLADYYGILSHTGQELSREQWQLANLQMKVQQMLEDYMGKSLEGEKDE